MYRNLKKDIPAYIALFVFFFLVPHIVMSVPGFLEAVVYSSETFEYAVSNIYLNLVWGLMPFSGGVIALFHVLSEKRFNPFLIVEAVLCVVTFLFRIPMDHFLVLFTSVIPLGLMESFCLMDSNTEGETRSKIFLGIAKNKKFLALVCFWSIVPLIMFQIQGYYLAQCNSWLANKILVLFSMTVIPLVFVTLPFFQLIEHPMTIGGVVGTIILYLFTMLLSLVGYNAVRAPLELFVIPYSIGYGIIIILTGICSLASAKSMRS